MPIYAAIDVGTNTVRFLVAEALSQEAFKVLHEEQIITRLGEGLIQSGFLQEGAMARTASAIRRFAEEAKQHRALAISAVATSAVREAANGPEFVARVQKEAGLPLRVIDPEEEARLAILGVSHALGFPDRALLVIDVGGGSTEFAFAQGLVPKAVVSTDLGVVKLTEGFLKSDPPRADELNRLAEAVRKRIKGVILSWSRVWGEGCRGSAPSPPEPTPYTPYPTPCDFVGTGGTATTLAAIDLKLQVYDGKKITGHRLSLGRVKELCAQLQAMPLRERCRVPGLEAARADLIVAGAIVILEGLEGLGYDQIIVSDGGLREGILLDLLRHQEPR